MDVKDQVAMEVKPKTTLIFTMYQQYVEEDHGYSVENCYGTVLPFGGEEKDVEIVIINIQPLAQLPPSQFQRIMATLYGDYKLNSEMPEYLKTVIAEAMEDMVKHSKNGQEIQTRIVALTKK